jgi:hypothetical protein
MKTIIALVLGYLFYFNCDCQQVIVVSKAMAVKVDPMFALKDADTTFLWRKKKYLIQSKELLDDKGEIKGAVIYGDVGYSTYSKKEIDSDKDFLSVYHMNRFIRVCLIDDHHIKINSKPVVIKEIDKKKKVIYYTGKDPDVLYTIAYK